MSAVYRQYKNQPKNIFQRREVGDFRAVYNTSPQSLSECFLIRSLNNFEDFSKF